MGQQRIKWGFKVTAPSGWSEFVDRHPEQALQPIPIVAPNNAELSRCLGHLQLLHRAVRAFDYKADKGDTWRLQLPGDCEDVALSLRAMLCRVAVPMGHLQLGLTKVGEQHHLVLMFHTSSHDSDKAWVADPLFRPSAVRLTDYEHTITFATKGDAWHQVLAYE